MPYPNHEAFENRLSAYPRTIPTQTSHGAAHQGPAVISVKALALGGGNEDGNSPLNEVCFVLDPTQFGLGFDVFIKAADSAVDPRSLSEWELHNNNTSNSDVQ